jgi:signal transduction histidine kinase
MVHRRSWQWRHPYPPPWWPKDEPWPPRRHLHLHDRRSPRRFFRTIVLAWLLILLLGVAGPAFVASHFAGGARVVAALVAGLLWTLLASAALAGRSMAPIGRVMEAADRVANGDYDIRVAEKGPPAVRALARSFNTMTERLQNHDRLRRDLMADVAHELRTPLTVIQGTLEGLIDGVYPRETAKLQGLLDETHVLSRLVDDLRTLALSESGGLKLQREPTDVASLARDVVSAFGNEASTRGVALTADAPADVASIEIDPVRIREVIGNLVSNALRHTPAGGSVTVRARDADAGVELQVHDTGSGMTPEDLARAFDRFYKSPGSRGSGLGLTIARNLVVAHGGSIRAASEPGGGTTVTVALPSQPKTDG